MKKIKALALAGVFTASLSATAFAEMADVKVGGEIRVRDVITNDYDLNNDTADRNNTVTSRTRVNVDAKIDETTKAFIQLQDTRVWGSEASTTDTSGTQSIAGHALGAADSGATVDHRVDVKQAYLQLDKLFGQPLSLKLGRQVLDYGDARLIGAFEWSNYGRSFDGLKLTYNTDAANVDLFTTKVKDSTGTLSAIGTEVGSTTTDKEDSYFNGLYVTVKTIPTSTLDLYLLEKKNTTDGEDMLTYGARVNGGAMNIDWTAEAAWQSGDAPTAANSDANKDANFWAVKAGYTIPQAANLRIGAEYDWASGQDSSSDNTAFDQLYPTNHPLYGVSDFAGKVVNGNSYGTNTLSNLQAWSINASAKPAKGLKLLAEYWNYSAEEDYAGGNDSIGTEFNIQAWYALSDNVGLHAYWARFMPNDEYADAFYGGNDDAADNVTLQVAVKF